jgi:predicted phage tail protein
MKAFLAALLFAVIAAVGVSMLLNSVQQPSSRAFTTGGARVGDPGNNLVGPT